MSMRAVIAAGGTAGHLAPGFAIADAIAARDPEATITFIGTRRGMELTLVPARGYEVRTTSVRPFGGGLRGLVGALLLPIAVVQAIGQLRALRADIVIGMGGYPSVPAVIAARLLRRPAIIHEANAVVGLANQICARFTRQVAVTFAATRDALRPGARVTGMPLRPEIAMLDREARRDEARSSFGLSRERTTVLAMGGSLGAARINEAVTGLAARWADRADVQILLATGRDNPVDGATPVLIAVPYIDRMDLAFAAADVVVARAGASSVAEIAATGCPSVLVPYPHVRRREQDRNAALLADAGAAVVVDDAQLTADGLAAVLEPLLTDPGRRARMADAARVVATTDAADRIADWAVELVGGRS